MKRTHSKLLALLGMAAFFGCSAPDEFEETSSIESDEQELTKPPLQPRGPCKLSAFRGNVAGKNKFVGILYMIWFDPTILPATSAYPWGESEMVRPNAAKSYDLYRFYTWGYPKVTGTSNGYHSDNGAIMDAHIAKFSQIGIDYMLVDFTNINPNDTSAVPANNPAAYDSQMKLLLGKIQARGANAFPKVVPFIAHLPQNATTAPNFSWMQNYVSTYPNAFLKTANGKPLMVAVPKDAGGNALGTLPSGYPINAWMQSSTDFRWAWGMMNTYSYGGVARWSFMEQTSTNQNVGGAFKSEWAEEIAVVPAYQQNWMVKDGVACDATNPNCLPAVSKRNGATFSEQWAAALASNPTHIIVSSWNEWGAQNLAGAGPNPTFTDSWKAGWNRDIEPSNLLASYGFSDTDRAAETGTGIAAHYNGEYYVEQLQARIAEFKSFSPNFVSWNQGTGVWKFKYGKGYDDWAAAQNYTYNYAWAGGAPFKPAAGDFDADGCGDIALRNQDNGVWYLTEFSGNTANPYPNGIQWAWPGGAGAHLQPFAGDWDNDGDSDLFLRDVNTGTISLALNRFDPSTGANKGVFGSGVTIGTWAAGSNYEPFAGDVDGNNIADFVLWNKTTGNFSFALRRIDGTYDNTKAFNWGVSDTSFDVFVGYFNGDGLLDVAARNLSNGTVHLAFGNGAGGFNNWYNYKSQVTGSGWNMFAH